MAPSSPIGLLAALERAPERLDGPPIPDYPPQSALVWEAARGLAGVLRKLESYG